MKSEMKLLLSTIISYDKERTKISCERYIILLYMSDNCTTSIMFQYKYYLYESMKMRSESNGLPLNTKDTTSHR